MTASSFTIETRLSLTGNCNFFSPYTASPDQLADVIGDLLADAFAQGPESDEEQPHIQDVPEHLPVVEEVVPVAEPLPLPVPIVSTQLSKQEREKEFLNLLAEKSRTRVTNFSLSPDIDPFSQWNDVIVKIVTDPRYALIKSMKVLYNQPQQNLGQS